MGGLRIIDVSNPWSPTEVGSYWAVPNSVNGVTVLGNYAYIADASGLRILDVTTPSSPSEIGYYLIPDARDVFVSNDLAYVAGYDNGLRIINVGTPTNPVETGYSDTEGYALGIWENDDYA